ncbi:MAG: phosphoribosyltransferase [Flavobacteriales bacterium]|jgi:xanthine phosphoribosyltransferase|nr:phosphoribosyltransferase [Flavobacteriales bacterium]MBQ2421901.1 phosphoribosyltransferase [Flavobacteriales bacterium]
MAYTFEEVKTRLKEIEIDEGFDCIVAIACGGIVPAGMLSEKLSLPVHLLHISLRDSANRPMYDAPRLVSDINCDVKGKRVLLVEDRIKTGATVRYALDLLREKGAAVVKTFAVNGQADYSLYDCECFPFPWKLYPVKK